MSAEVKYTDDLRSFIKNVFVFQSSTKTSECYADDTGKDDDDDNEDDDDDKLLVGHDKDPERLKAFNVSIMKVSNFLSPPRPPPPPLSLPPLLFV